VRLLDEGVVVGRPTEAIAAAGAVNEFLLLPTSDYDAADEHWEFLPGSTVECVFQKSHDGKIILVAQKLLRKPKDTP